MSEKCCYCGNASTYQGFFDLWFCADVCEQIVVASHDEWVNELFPSADPEIFE